MSNDIQANPPHPAANGNGHGNGRVFDIKVKALYYGNFKAVRDTAMAIERGTITAFIGPSGCGKSTVLRCLNRMNDLVRGFRFEGHVHFHGKDIYDKKIDPVAVRRYIGMVFQQPNPFAMSIYRNVTFGLRLNGYRGNLQEKVEQALARVGHLGRGEGQAAPERAWRCRAASSSGFASPGPSPPSRKCC